MAASYYLPDELPLQAYEDWQFADRWGWPPHVVDEIPARRADALLTVDNLIREVREGRRDRPPGGRPHPTAGGTAGHG